MPPRSPSDRPEGFAGWWGVREVDFLYGRIKRYTRFVIYGKWSLVSIALLLVAVLIIWPLVTKDKSGLRISFVDAKTAPTNPSQPVMNSPVYRGTGVDRREYKVVGEKAVQLSPALIEVTAVEATLMKPDGGWQVLTADKAEYKQDEAQIELTGNVVLTDSAGNEFRSAQATIDTRTMDVTGNSPIEGGGASGNIVASRFEIRDNGDRITFHRGEAPVMVLLERAKANPPSP
jgi:lipopolysaccharide export system protein LptC